jgi:hypothetical protein
MGLSQIVTAITGTRRRVTRSGRPWREREPGPLYRITSLSAVVRESWSEPRQQETEWERST